MRVKLTAFALALSLSAAASAAVVQPRAAFHVGSGPGGLDAQVRSFSGDGTLIGTTTPEAGFKGGVYVAAGDLNGDGRADVVVGAGPGAGPHVRAFDGDNGAEIRSFFAYDAQFTGGVSVATGDLNGDGRADIVTGAGPGAGPHVKVFDGATLAPLASLFAFDGGFSGGVRVAAADFGGDGQVDLIVGAGPGGGPNVKVFDGATLAVKHDFFAFDQSFLGGVSLATGRYLGNDALFVGAGAGGAPQVKVFNLADGRLLLSFNAFDPSFDGGVNLGFARIAGRDTLLTGMASRGGSVRLHDVDSRRGDPRSLNAAVLTSNSFNPFGDDYMDGVSLAGVAAVPEPATWAQLLMGFALLGLASRRKLAVIPSRR